MGNTTIIELDHDRGHEISKNPDQFLKQIFEQIGHAGHTGQFIVGGRVIAFFHRSGNIEKAWERFKRKWGG